MSLFGFIAATLDMPNRHDWSSQLPPERLKERVKSSSYSFTHIEAIVQQLRELLLHLKCSSVMCGYEKKCTLLQFGALHKMCASSKCPIMCFFTKCVLGQHC